MKKLFCTFLMLFISVFAHANIHIDGDVAKQVILSYIDKSLVIIFFMIFIS